MASNNTVGKCYTNFKEDTVYRSILEASFQGYPSKIAVLYIEKEAFVNNAYLWDLSEKIKDWKVPRNQVILYGIHERDGEPFKIAYTGRSGFVCQKLTEDDVLDNVLVNSTVYIRTKSDFFARVKDKDGDIVQRFSLVTSENM